MDKGEWKPSIARDLQNADLSSLLDDKTTNKIVQNLKKAIPKENPGFTGKYNGKPVKAKDGDLLAQMAQKLTKTEKICEAQRKEIKEKAETIQKYAKDVERLNTLVSTEQVLAFRRLEEENARLSLQVSEMEKFLADYGLK